MNPGDVLEGRGLLLQHGRLVANVHYHLTIPRDLYFLLNPTGRFHLDYEEYLGGFILVAPSDVEKISLGQYTLELGDKRKRTIQVERRYKKSNVQGKDQISFWVKVVNDKSP
jgi:hypothetical protein